MKTLYILLISLTIFTASFSQNLSKDDYIADLAYLKTNLPQKHTNLFLKTDKTTFENKIDAIKLMADSLNKESFTAQLFKLFVSIGDEHTRVEPKYSKILPIKFELFNDEIFAIGIDSTNLTILPAKLMAINNHPVEAVIEKFKEVIQHENKSYFEVGLLNFLNNPSFLKGINVSDTDDEAIFKVLDKNGASITIKLNSIPKIDIQQISYAPAYKNALANKRNSFYWYEYNPAYETIYVNYNSCREQEGYPFESFNQELFAKIETFKPKKIILDLRSNSGGNSAILNPFIDKIKESYLNKKNKFFVLIGKRTFSSALMNAIELKRTSKALLVGEPTSGNINHYGEVRGFALPKTKIVIGYSTKYWENWKGKNGPLKPDVKISYSIKNFENGLDEAITYVLSK